MTQTLGLRLSNGRRFLPLAATIVMFGLVYAFGVLSFPAMQDSQPLFNLVNTAPFLFNRRSWRGPRHHLGRDRPRSAGVIALRPLPRLSCSRLTGIPRQSSC